MAITCGKCKATHRSVATVRACYDDRTFACTDLVGERHPEDAEMRYYPCGATAVTTATGFTCEAGHDYTTPQARADQGWDYATEPGEADALARALVGHVRIGDRW